MDLAWYNDLNEWFPERDQSFVPIWGASWSDYSGCAWCVILEKDHELYMLDYCSSPYADDSQAVWAPYKVTYEQAIEEMMRWEEHLDQ